MKVGGGKNGTGKGGGKGTGKAARKEDGRKRMLTFKNFPDETQDPEIIGKIQKILKDVTDSLDESGLVFASSKTGTAGAAKFKTDDLL